MFESNRFSTAAPMTPQHVAASLRLMAIWHAYYVVETTNLNVDIKSLRSMARLVSKFSSEKNPESILNEIDRAFKTNSIQFPQFQSLMVNKYRYLNIINLKPYYNIIYSAEPLSLLTDELEEAVWKEYYLKFIESNIKNIGISSTACYILWQVFNRMADEQYYPPAVPKVDHQKILVKCAKVSVIKITIRDQ